MEEKLKEVFTAKKVVKQRNTYGGDISQTSVYLVDDTPIFVKVNENKNARLILLYSFQYFFTNILRTYMHLSIIYLNLQVVLVTLNK